MKYIALLRGINVGGNRKVEMKRLNAIFKLSGYSNAATYINSGNVIFESAMSKEVIRREAGTFLKKEFGFEIPVLIKTKREMRKIAEAIPDDWQNDSMQKTDVAYLFDEVDSKKIIDQLPIKKEFIDIRYVKGAIYWNVDRKNYNKSHLNKLIGHKLYQFMTVRNVNTARFLANYKQ
jgi:uncharacterized protein (DUF1697 family)